LIGFAVHHAVSPVPSLWIHVGTGEILSVSRLHMLLHTLRPGDDGWQLEITHTAGTTCLSGPEVIQALLRVLPRINASGAPGRTLARAVAGIERSGDSEGYLRTTAREQSRGSADGGRLCVLPREIRLALEIAANDERERRALDGELSFIEQAWRDAEGVAAIADGLLTPDPSELR